MNREVLAAIEQHRMLPAGGDVVVGVSGGADSVALLHVLCALAPQRGWRVAAAHLNHRLRGAESDRDEAFVRALCGRLGIPLTVESAAVAELARAHGQSVEEGARTARYHFFTRCAQAAGGARIATAHTLDDSAETVLLNLTRGSGLRGLCGIPPVRGTPEGLWIIRPLIYLSRAEIEGYCTRHALEYVTDSTNQSDAYTRNRLRHQVLPVLRDMNPALLRTLAGMSGSLRADADYLDSLAVEALRSIECGAGRYRAAELLARPEPVRRRVLLQLLAVHGIAQERRRVEQVERLLETGGVQQLSKEWLCRCERGALSFCPVRSSQDVQGERFQPVKLTAPYIDRILPLFSDKSLCISCVKADFFEKNRNNIKNQFKNTLDCAKMGKIVTIRQRMPGDRIRLAGRGCTKSLKKLFNEEAVPARERARTLVVAGGDGPLWIEGFGVAEDACVGPETRLALLLSVRQPDGFGKEGDD